VIPLALKYSYESARSLHKEKDFNVVENNKQTLTNAAGIPVPSNTVSKSVGKQGPLLLEDYTLLDLMYYDMLNNDEKKRLYNNIAGSLGKAREVVIKDQIQLFRNVYPELADKVESAIANTEPPKPEPKPATV